MLNKIYFNLFELKTMKSKSNLFKYFYLATPYPTFPFFIKTFIDRKKKYKEWDTLYRKQHYKKPVAIQ